MSLLLNLSRFLLKNLKPVFIRISNYSVISAVSPPSLKLERFQSEFSNLQTVYSSRTKEQAQGQTAEGVEEREVRGAPTGLAGSRLVFCGAAFRTGAANKNSCLTCLLGCDAGSNALRVFMLLMNTNLLFAHSLYFHFVLCSYVLGSSEKQIVSEDKEVFNLESRIVIENSLKQVTNCVLHATSPACGAPLY